MIYKNYLAHLRQTGYVLNYYLYILMYDDY